MGWGPPPWPPPAAVPLPGATAATPGGGWEGRGVGARAGGKGSSSRRRSWACCCCTRWSGPPPSWSSISLCSACSNASSRAWMNSSSVSMAELSWVCTALTASALSVSSFTAACSAASVLVIRLSRWASWRSRAGRAAVLPIFSAPSYMSLVLLYWARRCSSLVLRAFTSAVRRVSSTSTVVWRCSRSSGSPYSALTASFNVINAGSSSNCRHLPKPCRRTPHSSRKSCERRQLEVSTSASAMAAGHTTLKVEATSGKGLPRATRHTVCLMSWMLLSRARKSSGESWSPSRAALGSWLANSGPGLAPASRHSLTSSCTYATT
ncbi:hypothetical protein V8C86DRAFT_2491958 [Haematococcus lacustris]